jgi:transmembrane sensor
MGQADKNRRAKLEAEAAAWLFRIESEDADRETFERWRGDPEKAAMFAQLDAAWTRLDRLRALRPPGPPDPDIIGADEAPTSRRWFTLAAACGLGALGAGGAALLLSSRAHAETGVGERRALRLPDKSLLDLNTDSRASWRFDAGARRVWLERGEAALEVAHDPERRPFILTTGERTLALAEGVFNARLRTDAAEIVVLRGAAALGGEATVLQGRAAVLAEGRADMRALEPAAAEAVTAWRRGEVIFEDALLSEAVDEYNRYLAARIEIADPSIAGIRLSGRFITHDPEEFLASVERAFPVQVVRTANGGATLSPGN